MKNKSFLLLSLLMIAGLLLSACGGATATEAAPAPTNAAAPSDTSGGSGSAPASDADLVLDPANAAGDNARAAVGYLYEGLVRIQDGAPVGVLAESFTVSEDGLDYIFNLRPGVAFHDGSTLDADVVVSNFNRWFDPNDANHGSGEFAVWAESFGGFKGEVAEDGKPKSIYDGIEKVNEMIVLVHLNTPDADFLTKLSDPAFSIVSANAFNGGDGGTGAYKFLSLSDTTATLEPFAGYWDPAAIPSENMDAPLQ